MVDTAFQVAGTFTARQGRQVQSVVMAGATAARPLGGLSGVRPGTSPTTVSATSTTVTVGPFAGVIDAQTAAEAAPYEFAFDAITTMALTAADLSNPRSDIVFARINDTAEDGGGVTSAVRVYQAGTAGAGAPIPVPSVSPVTRALIVAVINVPKVGGGSPTVTWVAPYAVAAGGILPIDTLAHLNLIAGATAQYAEVTADSTAANNGLYHWTTAWVKVLGDTGWIQPTLGTGWTNVSGSEVKYRRLNGFTCLQGRASTTGATANAFTLPTGFCPSSQIIDFLEAGSATTRSTVQTTGVVGQLAAGAATNVSFAGFGPFPADN